MAAARQPGQAQPGDRQPRLQLSVRVRQERRKHHITPVVRHEKLTDPRLAWMLGVPEGTEVVRAVAGHRPAGRAAVPGQRQLDPSPRRRGRARGRRAEGTGAGRLAAPARGGRARASPGPSTTAPGCPPEGEASLLQIPVTLPVLEIVRVGRSAEDDQPIEVTMHVIPRRGDAPGAPPGRVPPGHRRTSPASHPPNARPPRRG